MILSENKKDRHSSLNKRATGFFGRNECAFLGSDCDHILSLVHKIRNHFPERLIGYADADHSAGPELFRGIDVTSAGGKQLIRYSQPENSISAQISFEAADAVIVNGNHFEGKRQIIIANPAKINSLRKRIAQITNPCCILLPAASDVVPTYIEEIPGLIHLPVYSENEIESFFDFYGKNFLISPPIKGLILTGGRSVRMGEDKSLMAYHGKPQYRHLYDLVSNFTKDVFISCRDDQRAGFADLSDRLIVDRISDVGPMGGIISAMMTDPDAAWMVVACDMPLIDESILNNLICNRNFSRVATAYQSTPDNLPEPLIAIWEPRAYSRTLNFLAHGISCPRKLLIHSDTKLIRADDPLKLSNINRPGDWEYITGRRPNSHSVE